MTTTKTHFDVYATDGYRAYIGERPTFSEAERLARWHAARRSISIQIDKVVQDTRRRGVEQMATVSRDALGRLWTDLTWHGALFI